MVSGHQNAQQHGAVWTTDNYLPIVNYTNLYLGSSNVKIIDNRFHFSFSLLFSIFRSTRVRGYQSQVDGKVTRLITRLGRIE